MTDPNPRSPSYPPGAALDAPWRIEYLEEMSASEKAGKAGKGAAGASGASGSFILDAFRDSAADVRNHVVVRTGRGVIMLNAYPYTSGHLLVALGDARPTLLDYDAAQRAALWGLVDLAMALVQDTLQPQGVNVGINQGRAAGAGLPQHFHVHLVPRWGGDVNFMSVVGQVRVIPASLEMMAARYRKTWEAMGGVEGWKKRSGGTGAREV